jgi:hypothetical protein
MVVAHIAAGALGMVIGLFLFYGYGPIWWLTSAVLSGNAAILVSGSAIAVRSYCRGGKSSRRHTWHSRPGGD